MKRLGLILLLALCAAPALAHKPSDSLVELQRRGSVIQGQWDIALRDLDHAIGLDADGDGAITWGELRRRHAAIAAYALPRLELQASSGSCALSMRDHLVDRHTDGAYAVLRFAADCGSAADHLTIRYRLLFDLDPLHRGILRINGTDQVLLFTHQAPEQRIVFNDMAASALRGSSRFRFASIADAAQVLFIVVMLLPALPTSSVPSSPRRRGSIRMDAVSIRMDSRLRGNDWSAEHSNWRAKPPMPLMSRHGARIQHLPIVKLTVALVIAHALSLAVATLYAVSLPADIVDVGLALMIIAAALSHLARGAHRYRWLAAFAFGILLGFVRAETIAPDAITAPITAGGVLAVNLPLAITQVCLIVAIYWTAWWASPRSGRRDTLPPAARSLRRTGRRVRLGRAG